MLRAKGEGSGSSASGSGATSGSNKHALTDPSQFLMEGEVGQSSNPDIIINDPKKAKKFSQRI